MPEFPNYDPKYLRDDDYPPISKEIMADFTDKETGRAVRAAENRLEAEVNDGSEILTGDRRRLHSEAVSVYAAYRLSRSPAAPQSMSGGQWADDGSDRVSVHNDLMEEFNDLVDLINSMPADGEDDAVDDGPSQDVTMEVV
jgi:hypothetical protein